jgi:hypothetical protein
MKFTPALRTTLVAGIVSVVLAGAGHANAAVNKYLGGTFSSSLDTSYNTSYGVSFDSKGGAFFQKNTGSTLNLPSSNKPSSLALDNSGNLYVVTSNSNKVTFTPAITSSVYVSDYETKSTTEYSTLGSVFYSAASYSCCPPPCWPPPCCPPPPCDPFSVPEPSTYAMLILGLGMIAYVNRRRTALLVPIKVKV